MPHLTFQAAAFALLAAFAAPFAGAAGPQLAPQVSNAASVNVKVTPRVVEGRVWEFEVVLDTHSQDLGDDLARNASLVGSDGKELLPLEWKGAPPGGHHRSGVLRFPAPQPAPDALELRIRRTGEASPRVFRWTLR
jgi:hypothetical protein